MQSRDSDHLILTRLRRILICVLGSDSRLVSRMKIKTHSGRDTSNEHTGLGRFLQTISVGDRKTISPESFQGRLVAYIQLRASMILSRENIFFLRLHFWSPGRVDRGIYVDWFPGDLFSHGVKKNNIPYTSSYSRTERTKALIMFAI